jgi:hypothetical protein
MTRNQIYRKSIVSKKNLVLAFAIIAALLIISVCSALNAFFVSNSNSALAQVPIDASQFNIGIAYAYVGPAPTNSSYVDSQYNATMYLESKYPSIVYLNITRNPGILITSCDAAIEVYGISIATNTGMEEDFTYAAGTNFNQSFSNADKIAMGPYISQLVDHRIYRTIAADFDFNWTENTSILSLTIGSIGWYSKYPISDGGLAAAGIPSTVSVTVHRIGYITMAKGFISTQMDAISNNIASIQLGKYQNGFLYNNLVPMPELPQINLFEPPH